MEITFKVVGRDVVKVLDEILYITEYSSYLVHNPKICISMDEWNELVALTRKIRFTSVNILDPPSYGEATFSKGLSIVCPEVIQERNVQKHKEKELKRKVGQLDVWRDVECQK